MIYADKNDIVQQAYDFSVRNQAGAQLGMIGAAEATVGTETDRAFESACECSKLVSEIATRVLGPVPTAGGSSVQQDDSLRGRIRKVANVNADTACTLRSILQAL